MTNEEKAIELIGCNPYSCKSSCVNFCQKTFHNGLMCKEKERLIKAMEWKDEQFAEEKKQLLKRAGDDNYDFRIGFIKGYDQAMQDFMEKAEKYLVPHIQSILLVDFR